MRVIRAIFTRVAAQSELDTIRVVARADVVRALDIAESDRATESQQGSTRTNLEIIMNPAIGQVTIQSEE